MLNARFKYARFQLDFFRPISHSNGVLFYQRACLSQYLTPRPQLRFKGNFFPCLYTRPPFSPSLSPPRLTIPPLPMIFTLSCQIFFTLSLLTSSRGETKPYWKQIKPMSIAAPSTSSRQIQRYNVIMKSLRYLAQLSFTFLLK